MTNQPAVLLKDRLTLWYNETGAVGRTVVLGGLMGKKGIKNLGGEKDPPSFRTSFVGRDVFYYQCK